MEKPHVHVTDVHQFMTCRTKWFYASQLSHGLRSVKPNKHLVLGSAVHYALGAYYGAGPTQAQWDKAGAMNAYAAYITREVYGAGGEVDDALADYIALGGQMLENYFLWAQDYDRFSVIMPEVSLLLDMGDYVFEGTTDGVIRDDNGGIWLLEHKTAAQFPNSTALTFSLQTAMYCWVANRMPEITQLGEVRGVVFNILRKAVPTVPKVLKSGEGVERRKDIGCTPKQYLSFVAKAGFDPADYVEFASQLDPFKFVHRDYISLPQNSLQAAVEEFKTVADEMVHNPKIYRCDPLRLCSWCDYRSLCAQKLFGRPWDEVADYEFVKATTEILYAGDE